MSSNVSIHPIAEARMLTGVAWDSYFDRFQKLPDQCLGSVVAVPVPEADGRINGSVAIISGVNKWRACQATGRDANLIIYNGPESPSAIAALLNILENPKLTDGQRLAYAVEVADQIAVDARKRQKAAGGDRKSLLANSPKAISIDEGDAAAIHSRDEAFKLTGVPPRTIGEGIWLRKRSPELFNKMRVGKIEFGPAKREYLRTIQRNERSSTLATMPRPTRAKLEQTIITGDCLAKMELLERRKFRLGFVDGPYNIGINYGNGSKADKRPDGVYLDYMERRLRVLPELLTPDGCLWVMINEKYLGRYLVMMERIGLHLRRLITIYYTFGQNSTNTFNDTSRFLIYLVRDPKNCVFNLDVFNRPSTRQEIGDRRAAEGGKNWDSIWTHIPVCSGTRTQREPDFPTQLSDELLAAIIEGTTQPGDWVLDPFSGSGTTAAAAIKLGRNPVGIEINPDYAEWSRARLSKIAGAK